MPRVTVQHQISKQFEIISKHVWGPEEGLIDNQQRVLYGHNFGGAHIVSAKSISVPVSLADKSPYSECHSVQGACFAWLLTTALANDIQA
jgi:hypothetical protein